MTAGLSSFLVDLRWGCLGSGSFEIIVSPKSSSLTPVSRGPAPTKNEPSSDSTYLRGYSHLHKKVPYFASTFYSGRTFGYLCGNLQQDMNIKKQMTTAFLMCLASLSYGQELTYLYCVHTEEYIGASPAEVVVLNIQSLNWANFLLFNDEEIEYLLTEEVIAKRHRIFNGEELEFDITESYSTNYILSFDLDFDRSPTFEYKLDRITGEISWGLGHVQEIYGKVFGICSPINNTALETLLQERISRRGEIIKVNEANTLF